MTILQTMFDTIYSTDLLYKSECWKLCGDAHCCSFSRYKGGRARQNIILLPHEYAYMKQQGYLGQYNGANYLTETFQMTRAWLRLEMLSIETAPKTCPCTHAMRPTTCRLYPLLPVFEVGVGLVGVAIYYGLEDEIEKAVGMKVSCEIDRIAPIEIASFLKIANVIKSEPNVLFHVMAYDCVRRYVSNGLVRRQAEKTIEPTVAEIAMALPKIGCELLAGSLFDVNQLRSDLDRLAEAFADLYGPGFQQGTLATDFQAGA